MSYKYFTEDELACQCNNCDGEMSASFMVKVDRLREACGFPFVVTSAYRCPEHNKAVGGAARSKHTQGKAIDVALSGEQAWQVIANARRAGINGIGVSQSGAGRFIHLDDRPSFAMWSY